MTKLEQNLIDAIYQTVSHDVSQADVFAIFGVDIGAGYSGYSAELFVKQGSEYINVPDMFGFPDWNDVIGTLIKPLRAIYDNQQKFEYLIIGHDEHGNFKFTYETESDNDPDMTIIDRYVIWEYDEFGIGDRTKLLDKNVLDKYRPLN